MSYKNIVIEKESMQGTVVNNNYFRTASEAQILVSPTFFYCLRKHIKNLLVSFGEYLIDTFSDRNID